MTSKTWRKRALVLGLASLASLPLAAARASEARPATRIDLPTWTTAAREQPGATSWTLAAKSGKAGKWGERGGSRGSKAATQKSPTTP
jgi:hypothetical protein